MWKFHDIHPNTVGPHTYHTQITLFSPRALRWRNQCKKERESDTDRDSERKRDAGRGRDEGCGQDSEKDKDTEKQLSIMTVMCKLMFWCRAVEITQIISLDDFIAIYFLQYC